MNYFYSLIILIFVYASYASEEAIPKKYIVIPISLNEENKEVQIYNSETFIQKYYNKNILLNFDLGSPKQKINGILLNDNICFKLEKAENISKSIKERYSPKYSTSFSMYNQKLYSRKLYPEFMIIGYDFISFDNSHEYNISFLFQNIQETYLKNISTEDITNEEYIAKIGLNIPIYPSIDNCPNFIAQIKKKANLEKYTISFEFLDSEKGNIIIGDELYNYNNKKYYHSQYVNTYSNDNNEIFFDDIILSKNNNNVSFNGSYGYLSFNLGVIIGSKEYKKEIDDKFFNNLIYEKVCEIENITFNISQNFFVYSCRVDKFDVKLFPKLIFVSKSYLYSFEFGYSDLFIKVDSKYYFLVIFKANNIKNYKDVWVLGQPFYIKYSFTLNIDENTIGFYNPDLPPQKEGIKDDDNYGENKKSNLKKIIIAITLIIVIIGLLIITFFLGMKMKEERKKRANELKDDYDYVSETNENIN